MVPALPRIHQVSTTYTVEWWGLVRGDYRGRGIPGRPPIP